MITSLQHGIVYRGLVYLAVSLTIQLGAVGADVASLAEKLRSSDSKERRDAAFELHQLGAGSVSALPALIEALDDDQDQVFFHSVSAIAKIGPAANSAIPALIAKLGPVRRRYSEQINLRASFALSRIGEAAVPALIEALRSSDETVSSNAIEALALMPAEISAPAVPGLVKLLGDERSKVGASATYALSRHGETIVPEIIDILTTGNTAQKSDAIRTLGKIGQEASSAGLAIVGATQQGESEILEVALDALVRLRHSPVDTISLIVSGLKSDDEAISNAAANAALLLHQVQTEVDTTPFADGIIKADEPTRLRFAAVLGRMDETAAPTVPALIRAAEEAATVENALAFAKALGGIGQPAAPLLIEAAGRISTAELTEESWPVAALGNIGEPALDSLRQGLKSTNISSRMASVAALGLLGTHATPATEDLFATLNDPDSDVRGYALIALPRAGVPADRMLPVLEPLASDESKTVRVQAFRALGTIKDSRDKTLPLLMKGMQDPEPSVQTSAIEAAGQIGEEAAEAVPSLTEVLDATSDGAVTNREKAAITALGKIGPAAKSAVPSIITRLSNSDSDVRLLALSSISSIGRGATDALPKVRMALSDDMPEVRAQAVEAMAEIAPDETEVTNILIVALDDTSEAVRGVAVKRLTSIGEDARPAAPKLFSILNSSEDPQPIIEALRNIRTREPALYITALASPSPSVRLFACEALARFGSDARSAIPELEKLQDDEYDFVRRRASQAIERINRRGRR